MSAAILLPPRIPTWSPTWTPAAQLVRGIHAAARAATGHDAGVTLASAGWAVFPVPIAHDPEACKACEPIWRLRQVACLGKHDQGSGAFRYQDATTDPAEWHRLSLDVARRHWVDDVNPACSPWRCTVPLVGIDLDGPEAVASYAGEHPMEPDRPLRVVSAGKGGGLHVYVRGSQPMTGTNPWGGEYRADRGHLMLPGSTIGGRRDYYRPAGIVFSTDTPRGGRVSDGRGSAPSADTAQVERLVAALSLAPPSRHAADRMAGHLDRIRAATPGERYPAARSAVAAAVTYAMRGDLPLRWALDQVATAYDEATHHERAATATVLDLAGWVLGQEAAS